MRKVLSILFFMTMTVTVTVMLWFVPSIEVSATVNQGLNTDINSVSGSEFTQFDDLASKLDSILAGKVGLYSNLALTNPVTTKLGTRSVPPGTTLYWKCSTTTCSGESCFAYAVSAYCTLYDGTHPGLTLSSNHEKIASASGSTISYDNFVNWGVRDDLPVYVQIGSSKDGTGHSIIVLTYTKDYIIYLDGNGDNNGLIAIRKEPWKNKFDSYTGSNIYARKISYIVQPKDLYYPTQTVNHDYQYKYEHIYEETVDYSIPTPHHWQECTKCGAKKGYEAHTWKLYSYGTDENGNEKPFTLNTVHIFECTICNAWKYEEHIYDNDCDPFCNVCNATRAVPDHSFGAYSYDSEKHWQYCTSCNVINSVQHIYTDNHDISCNFCGYTREATHSWGEYESVSKSGHRRTCSVCGEIDPISAHIYDTYQRDLYGHRKACSVCGEATGDSEEHFIPFFYKINDSYHRGVCTICNETLDYEHTYASEYGTSCGYCDYERTIEQPFDNQHNDDEPTNNKIKYLVIGGVAVVFTFLCIVVVIVFLSITIVVVIIKKRKK